MFYTLLSGWFGLFLGLIGLLITIKQKNDILTFYHIIITLLVTILCTFLGFVAEYGVAPIICTILGALICYTVSYIICTYIDLNKKVGFDGLLGISGMSGINFMVMIGGAVLGFVYWIR